MIGGMLSLDISSTYISLITNDPLLNSLFNSKSIQVLHNLGVSTEQLCVKVPPNYLLSCDFARALLTLVMRLQYVHRANYSFAVWYDPDFISIQSPMK